MLFSSLDFLFYFLPIFLLVYGLAAAVFKNRIWIRNGVLLVFSLFFYAFGEAVYLLLLLFSIVMNYIVGLLIESFRSRDKEGEALASLIAGVTLNLLMLGIFKYAGFFVSTLNAIGKFEIPVPEIALPIGISFFTFQIMSYIIDVYKRKVEVQKNAFTLAVYLCAFPQLIAGPIVRYSDVCAELKDRKETLDGIYRGTKRFIFGLSKKVILANELASVCDGILGEGLDRCGAFGAWIAILSYTLQIYYDFSGYSDMAIGLGKIMGFDYKENFNYPYSAKSVTDFWRRWHISLSSFFREYVYIPLGGNRVSKPRWVLNLLIVWGLTGLWHGASVDFILWGLYFGVLLVLEKLLWGKELESIPVVNHLYATIAFVFGWVFFRMESLSDIGLMFGAMFGKFGMLGTGKKGMVLAARNGFGVYFLIVFAIAVALSLEHSKVKEIIKGWGEEKATTAPGLLSFLKIMGDAFTVVLLLCCIWMLEVSTYNPFIYFRF